MLAYLFNFVINHSQTIIQNYFNFKMKLKINKKQQNFFGYEKYKNKITIYGINYFYYNNYLFKIKNFKNKFKISKNIIKIIILYFSKDSKYFDYVLNKKKKYNRLVSNNSINYFKLDVQNEKDLNLKIKKNDQILNIFFIGKKEKKKLVLILLLDGLSKNLTKHLPNTKKFFPKNNCFSNVYTNSPWTLPTFSNLLTGQYTSRHLNFSPDSYYGSFNYHKKNASLINPHCNLFEFFKSKNFTTGCYSSYPRINPTYNFDKGVDIFKFCEKENTNEITDNIISQLEMFNEGSNFIFAHLNDVHHKAKNFNQISDYAKFPVDNFDYKKHIDETYKDIKDDKYKKFIQIKNFHQRKEVVSDVKYCDLRLGSLYHYLRNKKFDDYTIILMGDHGTRLDKSQSENVLNKNHQNIGFFIKDKKNKFKNKKNNLIETIDIFPSLTSRFSKNNPHKKLIKQFDGKNTLFSSYKKKITLSESIYNNKYDLFLNSENMCLNSSYKINNNFISKNYYKMFTNKKGKKINASTNNKIIQKFNFIEKQHIKKIDLT